MSRSLIVRAAFERRCSRRPRGESLRFPDCEHRLVPTRLIEPFQIVHHFAYLPGPRVVNIHSPVCQREDWNPIFVGSDYVGVAWLRIRTIRMSVHDRNCRRVPGKCEAFVFVSRSHVPPAEAAVSHTKDEHNTLE